MSTEENRKRIEMILENVKYAFLNPKYLTLSKEGKLRIKRDAFNRIKELKGIKAVNTRRS
jgi:hypothetical protein